MMNIEIDKKVGNFPLCYCRIIILDDVHVVSMPLERGAAFKTN